MPSAPFSFRQFRGESRDFKLVQNDGNHSDRERELLSAVEDAIGLIVKAIDGYVVVNSLGRINEFPDAPGDYVTLQITSIARPLPSVDAGLAAAGGSARNFPPEASTAAPATEDASPPAAQSPIPQPLP